MALGMAVNFDGTTRQAVTFYAEVFGLETPQFVTYGMADTSYDPNFQVSEKMKDWVMRAKLVIDGVEIEFSDMPDTFEFIRGNSFTLSVTCENAGAGRRIYEKLLAGGQAFVPYGEIPGQGYYGMLGDRFGLCWIVKA